MSGKRRTLGVLKSKRSKRFDQVVQIMLPQAWTPSAFLDASFIFMLQELVAASLTLLLYPQ